MDHSVSIDVPTKLKLPPKPNTNHALEAWKNLIGSPGWYYIGRGFCMREYEEGNVTLEFKPFGEQWDLAFITTGKESRGKGLASRCLQEICKAADAAKVEIVLMVSPQGKGGLNKIQLFGWYQRYGFVRQAYAMEPQVLSDNMVRKPR